jgi:hypothetical protein
MVDFNTEQQKADFCKCFVKKAEASWPEDLYGRIQATDHAALDRIGDVCDEELLKAKEAKKKL